jgi:hypothetical protein
LPRPIGLASSARPTDSQSLAGGAAQGGKDFVDLVDPLLLGGRDDHFDAWICGPGNGQCVQSSLAMGKRREVRRVDSLLLQQGEDWEPEEIATRHATSTLVSTKRVTWWNSSSIGSNRTDESQLATRSPLATVSDLSFSPRA